MKKNLPGFIKSLMFLAVICCGTTVWGQTISGVTFSPTGGSYCSGGLIDISFTTTGLAGSQTYTLLLSDGTGSFAAPTNLGMITAPSPYIPSVALPVVATTNSGYLIKVSSGTASATSSAFTINAVPTVTVSTPAQTLCSGTPTTAVTFTGTTGTTYTWTNTTSPTPGVNIGLSAGSTSDITSFTATNTGTSAVTANISVTPSIGTCMGTPQTATITVSPAPTVTVSAPTQAICNGAPTTAITFTGTGTTYTWTNTTSPTPGVNIGLSAGSTGDIASFTATNTGTSAVTANISVTPSIGTCTGTAQTATITVNPTPTVTISPNSQMVCNTATTATVPFNPSVTGTTYTWTTIPAIGLTTTSGTLSFTAVNTGNTVSTGNITNITPHANGCDGTPVPYTFNVNPTPTVTISPNSQSVCNTATTTTVPFNPSVTGTTYTWTTIPAIGLNTTSGTLSFAAINNGNMVSSGNVTTITPHANGCDGTPVPYAFNVNPTPTVTISPNSQSVCNTATTTALPYNAGVTGTTYTWTTIPAIGLNTTSGTLSFAAVNTGSTVSSGNITNITPHANGCDGTPVPYTFNVNPTPTVTISPNSQTICNNTTTTNVPLNATVTGTTYTWTTAPAIGLTTTSGALSFTAINSGTTIISSGNVTSITPHANGCDGAPVSYTFNVNPTPAITSVVTDTVCNSATAINSISLTTNVGYVTTFTSTASSPALVLGSGGSGTIGASSSTFMSFTATNSTNSQVINTISITPIANNCTGPADIVHVTINPPPAINTLTSQTVCSGTPVSFNFSNTSGALEGYNYVNDNSSIGAPGTGSGNVLFTALNNIDTDAVDNLSVTPFINASGNQQCLGTAATATITVRPVPGVTTAVTGQTVCNGASTQLITFSSPVAGVTYTWTSNNTAIGLSASGTGSSIPGFVANNTSNDAITDTITVTATTTGIQCPGNPTPVITITVAPQPNVTVSPSSIPMVCNDSLFPGFTFSTTTSPSLTTTYNWVNSNPASASYPVVFDLQDQGTGNIAAFHAYNTSTTPSSQDSITVTPYISIDTIQCVGMIVSKSISVNPTPKLLVNGLSALFDTAISICNNGTVVYTAQSDVAGASFTWWRLANPGISTAINPVNGITNVISESLTNSASSPAIVNYKIALAASGCPDTVTVYDTVYPTLRMNYTPVTICDKSTFNYSANSSFATTGAPTGSLSYAWSHPGDNVGNSTHAGQGDIIESLFNNNHSIPITVTYTDTIHLHTNISCTDTQPMMVTVRPYDSLISPLSDTICSSATVGYTAMTSVQSNDVTLAWAIQGGPSYTGNGNTITVPAMPADTTGHDTLLLYNITQTAFGSCTNTTPVTVVIKPSPVQPTLLTDPFDPLGTICPNLKYKTYAASAPEHNTVNYYWSAQNAQIIRSYSSDVHNTLSTDTTMRAIVSFENSVGSNATLYITANDVYNCPSVVSYTIPLKPNRSPSIIQLVDYNHTLSCQDATQTTYQWGKTDMTTLIDYPLTQAGNFQTYYYGPGSLTPGFYYWVETTDAEGCLQRTYLVEPIASSVTAVSMANTASLKLYPNPANDFVTAAISNVTNSNTVAEVYDMVGRKVFTGNMPDGKIKIPLNGFVPGYYLISCYNDGIKLATGRFIKN